MGETESHETVSIPLVAHNTSVAAPKLAVGYGESISLMEKKTYTPAEFAAVFGKERTWAYRQLYAGKVKAITKLGQIQIPQTEVDKLLAGAERYNGSPSHVKRTAKRKAAKKVPASKSAKKWTAAVKLRKKHGLPQQESARSASDHKPSLPKSRHRDDPTNARRLAHQRLTRYTSSRKDGEGHDG